ncbi:uncharacterized protein LOC141500633 [Macrotis lagotis]|uniref:uncharacterized protein LOC141500633 n=1 Tax=Macrotis lagotis TaxID=92651 RepID=UPI003D680342
MYMRAFTLIICMEMLFHLSIYSAPVNFCDSSTTSMASIILEDEKLDKQQHYSVHSSSSQDTVGHQKNKNEDNKQVGTGAGHEFGRADMEKIRKSLLKKGFNWPDAAVLLKKALKERIGKNSSPGFMFRKKAAGRKASKNFTVIKEWLYTETKDQSVKKGITWSEEIILFGCLSLLLALIGGAALWLAIYTYMKREEFQEADNVAETPVSFKPPDDSDTFESGEPFPTFQEREKEFKALLHTVLKAERKKKKRKKRRGKSDSKLDFTRRGEMLAQRKKSDDLGFNTDSTNFPQLDEQIVKIKNLLENGKMFREKIPGIIRGKQVLLSVDFT